MAMRIPTSIKATPAMRIQEKGILSKVKMPK
jgi:hypothetical protein